MKKHETKSSDLCSSNDVEQLLSSLGLENVTESTKKEENDVKNLPISKNDHREEVLFEISIKKFVC